MDDATKIKREIEYDDKDDADSEYDDGSSDVDDDNGEDGNSDDKIQELITK